MDIGIILETKEHEKAWNAFRFAITALKRNHEVILFLMGEAVEIESIEDKTYDVPTLLEQFIHRGGQVMACGTCLKSRQLDEKTACPISTMVDCVGLVEWADKIVTF